MRRIHYSWIILGVTFFSIIVAGIVRSSSGVFVVPFENEFGWDRSIISLAFAISLLLYGLSGPFMAALIEIFGIKRMMLIGMTTLIVGLVSTYLMEYSWQLILIWGFIIGLGSGLFLTVLSTYIANRWFEKRRGLALGILTASTATGQLILLPVLASMIENYSWRIAIGIILFLSLIMLIVILLLMKNTPKEMGILPYGLEQETNTEQKSTNKNPIKIAFGALHEAVKVKEFWLLAGSFFICGLSTSGLIGTHFIPFCISFGIPMVTAAGLLSFMGVFDLIGTTISGWLSDRFDNRWLLFWYYGFRGLSLLLLPFALASGSTVLLVLFAVFYGLDWIATVPPTIGIARQVFGVEKSGLMYGWIFASHQVGAAVAAFGGGLLFTLMGSYMWAFLISGLFCLVASLFVIVIKKEPAKLEKENSFNI